MMMMMIFPDWLNHKLLFTLSTLKSFTFQPRRHRNAVRRRAEKQVFTQTPKIYVLFPLSVVFSLQAGREAAEQRYTEAQSFKPSDKLPLISIRNTETKMFRAKKLPSAVK